MVSVLLVNCRTHSCLQLQPALREECKESAKCAALTKHFEHCQEKVQSGKGFKHEDCVEELCVSNITSTPALLY